MTQSVFRRIDEWQRLCCDNLDRIEIDRRYSRHENVSGIKRRSSHNRGFSLVEVTLALGVAAVCLLVLSGLLPTGLKTQQSSIQQTTANEIIGQISAVLRADIRLPPGQANKVCPDPPDPNVPCNWGALHGHWRTVGQPPDTLYFTNNAYQTGGVNGSPTADAVFRAKLTYRTPPSETTSLATIRVTWPAAVDPDSGGVPAGSVTSELAVNR